MNADMVDRARTAISRSDVSRPLKTAMGDGLLAPDLTVFDYGCGRGDDVELLCASGFDATGWDPHYAPTAPVRSADVVNLGYVLNVIENVEERRQALRRAWALTKRLLVVSAQVVLDDRLRHKVPYEDGYLTRRGTFQKFFEQAELKQFLESVCDADACAAGIGIYYVFRDDALRHAYLASRFTQRPRRPRVTVSEQRFDAHRELLESLMGIVEDLGRLPDPDEYGRYAEVQQEFRSLKRAFSVIRRVTGAARWDAIAAERRADVLVLLALMRFDKRPSLSAFPLRFQRDVRAFGGNYRRACADADKLLFSAGDQERLREAIRNSTLGKVTPVALYVHESAVTSLSPLLRVYEACARRYLGINEPGTVIKLHRREPAVSYLTYPDFLNDAHPRLHGSMHVSLRDLRITLRDYSRSANPPILHRKELFLAAEHPDRPRFAELTEGEERMSLLDSPRTVGNLKAWLSRLRNRQVKIVDHELRPMGGCPDEPRRANAEFGCPSLRNADRSGAMTIAEAAIEVLRRKGRPMTVDEIYDAIVATRLYQFNTIHPKSVLRTQIRRRCRGVTNAAVAQTTYFELTHDGKYVSRA